MKPTTFQWKKFPTAPNELFKLTSDEDKTYVILTDNGDGSYDIDTTHFFLAPPYGWEDYYETENEVPQDLWEVSSDSDIISISEIEYYAPFSDILPIID